MRSLVLGHEVSYEFSQVRAGSCSTSGESDAGHSNGPGDISFVQPVCESHIIFQLSLHCLLKLTKF